MISLGKCMACGKELTVADKYDDICNDCWDYAEFSMEQDLYREYECGACGELHTEEQMIGNMCSHCFSVIVGE